MNTNKPMGRSNQVLGLLLLGWLGSLHLHLVAAVRTHREHKVHNIVLYPDKHSWCNTTPIKQVVAWPGCVAREIDNNVCVGTCFSYTIPQTQPSTPGDVISPYCDSCQPSEITWLELTLECSREEEAVETLAPEPTTTPASNASSTLPPLQMQKRVQVIANCSCSSCHGHSHHHVMPTDHVDSDVIPQPSLLDVPELMGLMRQVQTRKMANQSSTVHPPVSPMSSLEATDSDDEQKKEGHTEPSSVPSVHPPVLPVSSEGVPHHPVVEAAPFETPVVLHEPTVHAHHPHGHHAHAHHPHHHGHHHGGVGAPPAHLEVPQEKLQPAQEGAEMSYHDNLVPTDQSSDRDEEF